MAEPGTPAYASDNLLFIQSFPPESGVPIFPVNGEFSPTFQGPASGRSRLPVYGASLDEVVGVVHARDVLGATATQHAVRELARPPLFVAASARLDRFSAGVALVSALPSVVVYY